MVFTRRVRVIAKNTVIELLRNRILYVILIFAIVILMMSGALARFDAQIQQRILKDLSFSAISFFSLMVTLFITIEQVPNELDRKTIYFLLTKPVYRFEFLVGKFLGVAAVLWATLAIMGGVLVLILRVQGHPLDPNLIRGLLMLGAKQTILMSLLTLLSTFVSKILNVTLALFVFLFGHVGEFLQFSFSESGSAAVSTFLAIVQLILPNFRNFDVQSSVVHEVEITGGYLAILLGYSGLFCLLFLLLGHLVFRSRDL